MTQNIQKLDPDSAINMAYDIFLEMAGENLDPADILLFNLQFEERGAVEFVETADDWEQEIGVLIDPKPMRKFGLAWSINKMKWTIFLPNSSSRTAKKTANTILFGKNN